MSLLTIVQDASLLVGINSPTTVVANTSLTYQQILAFAQQEGDELSRSHDWRRLKVRTTITGDGVTTSWPLPSDFDRQVAGDMLWLNQAWRLLYGPLSDEDFLALQSGLSAPPTPVWRYFGNNIETYPALASGQIATYEYRSTNWILAADLVTGKSRWTVDTDTAVIPERVITLGVIWRFKRAKGLDYAEEFQTYQKEMTKAWRSDAGFRTLQAAERYTTDPIDRRKNAYVVIP